MVNGRVVVGGFANIIFQLRMPTGFGNRREDAMETLSPNAKSCQSSIPENIDGFNWVVI